MAIRQKKDGRWSVYYNENGKRREEYFGRGPDAEDKALRRNIELGLGRRLKKSAGATFGQLSKTYYENKNFPKDSRYNLMTKLKAIILPILGNKPAGGLVDQDLDNYVKKRINKGVKFSTINCELTTIKAILNFSANRKPPMIPYNPVRDYKKLTINDQVEIEPPTQKEIEAILKNASPHVARAVKLSWYLGLRPGPVELFSLNWSQVSWENKTIRVISAQKGNKTSNPVSRPVPIHKKFIDELKGWYEMDNKKGPIIRWGGKPVASIQYGWASALKNAGITRRIRPYDMRHAFITKALTESADIKTLSQVVGSSPETIIKYYQHVTNAAHRKTVDMIPEISTPAPTRNKNRATKNGHKNVAKTKRNQPEATDLKY